MKSRLKKWMSSFRKRLKKNPRKAFGLLELLLASSTMIVVLVSINQRQKTTGSVVTNVKLGSEFNSIITYITAMASNSTNCAAMLSNRKLNQVTPGPISPAQSIAPLLTNGASGSTILQLGPLGSNLNVTNIEFNNVATTGTPNQYIVNLHIAAKKHLPSGMVGNSTLTNDFTLQVTTNPGAGNAITSCQGQGNDFWKQAVSAGDIYYPNTASINESAPMFAYPLWVKGAFNVMGASQIRGGGPPTLLGFLGTATGFIGGAGGYGWIQTYGNTDLLLQPTLSGVGIGSLNLPNHTLDVTGTAGLTTGTAWINASDIRLKDILGDYEYGLKEIAQIHTVRFQYKKDNALKFPSDKKLIGIIAQEVQNIIPDAIQTNEKNHYLDLNPDPIHWSVVNAIQELYALVQTLNSNGIKTRLSKLQLENTKLKEENISIKKYLCSHDSQSSLCQ